MGKKGGLKHLKRKPAPRVWAVERKKYTWIVKPSPGPHPIAQCLPLTLILRDFLKLAKTAKEAEKIVAQEKVYVDGKIRRDASYPAGIMDVITLPEAERSYRVLPSQKGLILHPIEKDEASFKLCRIENKTTVENANVQLNLHDGTSILVHVADPKNPSEDTYRTLGTLKINPKTKEILGYIKLVKGAPVLLIGGKNVGKHGRIIELEEREGQKRRSQLATMEDKNGNHFQTTVNMVFVVGETEPFVSLPEVK
jgi:small subunit ribosomal protein S4e